MPLRVSSFKLQEDLVKKLEQVANERGVSKTSLVVEGLRIVLNLPPSDPIAALEERLEALESEVSQLKTLASAKRPSQDAPRQAIAPTQDESPLKPPATVRGDSNNASDATIRRWAKKEGIDVQSYASKYGYEKQGTGNRAIWIKK